MNDQEFIGRMNGHAQSYAMHAEKFRKEYRFRAGLVLWNCIVEGIAGAALDQPILGLLALTFLPVALLLVKWGDQSWERMMRGREEVLSDRDRLLKITEDAEDSD